MKTQRLLASLATLAAAAPFARADVGNFDNLNGYAATAETRLANLRTRILQPLTLSPGLVFDSHYVDRKIDALSDLIQRDMNTWINSLGYNFALGGATLGVELAWDDASNSYTEINSPAPQPLAGDIDSTTVSGTVSLGFDTGGTAIVVFAGLGSSSHDGVRRSDAGTSTTSFDSSDWSLGVVVSHPVALSSGTLTPYLGLEYASSKVDSFTEQGSAPDRRVVAAFDSDVTTGSLGLTYTFKSDWSPAISVAWLHEFNDDSIAIANTAINGSNLSTGVVPNAAQNLGLVGVSVKHEFDEGWSAGAGIHYVSGGDESSWNYALHIGKRF